MKLSYFILVALVFTGCEEKDNVVLAEPEDQIFVSKDYSETDLVLSIPPPNQSPRLSITCPENKMYSYKSLNEMSATEMRIALTIITGYQSEKNYLGMCGRLERVT